MIDDRTALAIDLQSCQAELLAFVVVKNTIVYFSVIPTTLLVDSSIDSGPGRHSALSQMLQP